jgi:hypothetical protein
MWSLTSVPRRRYMFPTTVGQEPMIAARYEFSPIVEDNAVGRLRRSPLVEHMGNRIPAVSTDELGSIDRVTNPYLGQRLGTPIGHQDRSISTEAVRAGMRTSPIHVDRPLERQVGRGDPVEDGLGFDLVEGDVAELGAVEGAHRCRCVEEGQVRGGPGLASQVGEGLHRPTLERVFGRCKVVCVRLSGRVSGLIRDREFDLEQEQRPGAGRDAAAAGARGAGP